MASRAALLRAIVSASLLAFGTSCFSTESSAVGTSAITLITVDPGDFLGDVRCGSEPGAMRSYVATLTDISVAPPFRLPSSGPSPCEFAVSFAFVVPGHGYVASIEAYDRDDLVPLGGKESGSPIMLDAKTGERVEPVWRTQCGNDAVSMDDAAAPAAIARGFRQVRTQGCSALHRIEKATEAKVSLDPSNALFGLSCGDEAGQITRFRATPLDASLPTRDASCGETLVFDVEAGRFHAFDLSAFEAGHDEARYSARCIAESQAGMTLPAKCTPLSSKGTIRLHVGELLEHHGLACSADGIESYNVVLGDRVIVAGASCRTDAVLGPLAPGEYEPIVVALARSDGKLESKLTTRCPAVEVSPGRSIETNCLP